MPEVLRAQRPPGRARSRRRRPRPRRRAPCRRRVRPGRTTSTDAGHRLLGVLDHHHRVGTVRQHPPGGHGHRGARRGPPPRPGGPSPPTPRRRGRRAAPRRRRTCRPRGRRSRRRSTGRTRAARGGARRGVGRGPTEGRRPAAPARPAWSAASASSAERGADGHRREELAAVARGCAVIRQSRGCGRAAAPPRCRPEDAGHRAERHLAEAADRRRAQGPLQLEHLRLAPVVQPAGGQRLGQQGVRLGRADPAGHALAARLVPEEPQRVGRGREQVGALGHRHQRAGAEHRAGLGERVEVQPGVEAVRAEEVRGRAAGLHRGQRAARPSTPPARSSSARTVVPIGTQ